MIRPVPGVSLPLTGTRSYLFQRSDTHQHRGIDLPARAGTPVFAAADGSVDVANVQWQQGFTGYGRVVVLRHPTGVWTLYAHLQDVLVAPGVSVRAGEQIGTVGRTEFASNDHTGWFAVGGEHLHFEVSPHAYPQESEAERLDPVAWLQGGGLGDGTPDPFVFPPVLGRALALTDPSESCSYWGRRSVSVLRGLLQGSCVDETY